MRAAPLLLASALLAAGCSNDSGATADGGATPRLATVASGGTIAPVALREEQPGLLARARVAEADARALALARVPAGRVVDAELEEEDGRLIYAYDLELDGQPGIMEVEIDAMTGEVLSVEHEDEEDSEDDEDDPGEQEDGR